MNSQIRMDGVLTLVAQLLPNFNGCFRHRERSDEANLTGLRWTEHGQPVLRSLSSLGVQSCSLRHTCKFPQCKRQGACYSRKVIYSKQGIGIQAGSILLRSSLVSHFIL